MKKRLLVVDDEFAQSNNLDCYTSIFPNIGYEPDWALPFEEHTKHYKLTVILKKKLTDQFVKNIYSPSLGYSEFACERLFLNYGSLIIFVLSDRLLRINKLAGLRDLNQFHLPKINFEFNTDWTFGHFYYKKVEKDPIYNQWLINKILPELQTIQILKQLNSDEGEYGMFYSNKESIKKRILRNFREATLSKKIFKILADLYPNIILYLSRLFNTIPIDAKNVTFLSFKANLHNFFWPFGPLSPLESISFKVYPPKLNTKIQRKDFLEHKEFVADTFKEFLINAQGECNLPNASLEALIEIIAEQLPSFTTEQAEVYCAKYLREFEKYKGSFFLVDGMSGNTLKSLRVFACRELSIPVVATQHSGWGGYLSNGALVNEILIDGADDYITFGWDNKTDGESMWIDRAIKLPSPLLSQLKSINSERFRETHNNRILFSLGFIYRFPAFHNSFLRLDTINDYLRLIESAFHDLSKSGWNISVSFYNNDVANFFSEKSSFWVNAENLNVTIIEDHDLRLRDYMQSKEFDNLYDAIIWDIPAGGFSESIALGKKSFAFLNKDLIHTTSEAMPFIKSLLNCGILFKDGSDITSSLNQLRENKGWYLEENRQRAIDNFFDQFLQSDPEWKDIWLKFLSNQVPKTQRN